MSVFKPQWARFLLLAVVVNLLAACSWLSGKKYLVPEKKNAQEQFSYAVNYEARTKSIPTKKKEEVYERIVQAYEVVIERFPEDTVFTPMTYLRLGDLFCEQRQFNKALSCYDTARKRYANQDRIQAYAQLKRGKCYEAQGDTEGALEQYKGVIDLYSNHADRGVQALVKEAQGLYDRVLKK